MPCNTVCGLDADDVFAYERERTVRIRHKWLGLTYYVTVLGIVLYIAIYQLAIEREFTEFTKIWGAVRTTAIMSDTLPALEELPYCLPAGSLSSDGDAWRRPCVTWALSETTSTQPRGGIFIATRAKQTLQVRSGACDDNEFGCQAWLNVPESIETFFIGAVGNLTLNLQHSAYDSSLGVSVETFGLPRGAAKVKGPGGSVATSPTASGDVVSFADLLAAAEVDLNSTYLPVRKATRQEAGSMRYISHNTPLRERGLTVVLSAMYAGGREDPGYAYDVWADEIEASMERTEQLNATARLVTELAGVQVFFEQEGGVKTFDFRTLLLTLVTGSALIASAKTVADLYLRYLSPHRDLYRFFVFSSTPDLDPDDERGHAVLESVVARKRWKDDFLHARERGDCPRLATRSGASINGTPKETGSTALIRASHTELNGQI